MERMVVHPYIGISLQIDLYMTQKDQIFVVGVVVIDSMQETMASNVISQPTCVTMGLNTITK
jgi:hypothetical protein